MNVYRKVTLNIFYAYVMFYICFKHFFIEDTVLYIILNLLFIIVLVKQKIHLKRALFNRWFFWSFLVIKFTIVYIDFLLIGIIMSGIENWQAFFWKWLKGGFLFNLLFTFFAIGFPDMSLDITKNFLPPDAQNLTQRWLADDMPKKAYAGIAGQTGTNAFFFSMLLGMFFSEIISNDKKKRTILLLGLTAIGLYLTRKKGLLLSSSLSIIALVFILYRKKKLTYILMISMSIGLIVISLFFHSQIYNIFKNSIDGRLLIYDGMFRGINNNLLLGNGVSSIGYFTYEQHSGHNIYLQMWTEQGLVGLGLLLLAMVFSIYCTTIKMTRNKIKDVIWGREVVFSLYVQLFVLFYGMTGNPIYDYNIVLVYFISIALPNYNKNIKWILDRRFNKVIYNYEQKPYR